ncbi:MAG TPA: lysophospholipid acyltransferase family protein [Longimicrobiales bacterium]|nr:lysophospholipid acyltransferase family protein [Longimicrobiales bacterium]
MSIYAASAAVARLLARLYLPRIEVRGRAHVPPAGPFLLLANHQSILDPILIQAFCPRPLHTMTKSTQFAAPGMGWYLPRLNAFPVRRFQVDPQAVRFALRRLEEGHGVGIYVEGERSWDARLQPPRLGTLRLMLKAGVPVVPCAIAGSYDVWPRWHGGLRRAPVRITFGEPLRFPRCGRRAEREPCLEEASQALMAALRGLLGAPAAGPEPAGRS